MDDELGLEGQFRGIGEADVGKNISATGSNAIFSHCFCSS